MTVGRRLPPNGRTVEQRTIRPRIADVAREAGVSKTAVSFAFNSPDRLSPETANRIRVVADQLGYSPHPVARMLTQRQTLTIGVLTPQALSVVFSNPFFGAFTEGVAAVAEDVRLCAPLHLAAARLAGPGDEPGDRRRRGRHRPERRPSRRSRRSGGRACRSFWSTRPRWPITTRSRSTTWAAPGRRPSTSSRLGHRDILIIGVEPPLPSRTMEAGGVTGRRLRGYREAFAAVGIEIPDERVVVGPASIAGGIAALNGPGRTASARPRSWR